MQVFQLVTITEKCHCKRFKTKLSEHNKCLQSSAFYAKMTWAAAAAALTTSYPDHFMEMSRRHAPSNETDLNFILMLKYFSHRNVIKAGRILQFKELKGICVDCSQFCAHQFTLRKINNKAESHPSSLKYTFLWSDCDRDANTVDWNSLLNRFQMYSSFIAFWKYSPITSASAVILPTSARNLLLFTTRI